MSCARPVILGVEGQARQIVEEAQAGICIAPENADDLARAIVRLAGNPQMGETFGRNGRRHVLQYFSRRQSAATYSDLLKLLVGEEERKKRAAAA
jgi:glycosyltransferase involved in cell wall biosynthesis